MIEKVSKRDGAPISRLTGAGSYQRSNDRARLIRVRRVVVVDFKPARLFVAQGVDCDKVSALVGFADMRLKARCGIAAHIVVVGHGRCPLWPGLLPVNRQWDEIA
jgi:hypothetical protein